MKFTRFLIPALLSGILCLEAKAEDFPVFKFRHYTVDDGLSVNTVTGIIQDSRGFIWFATSAGINRYDGVSFRSFVPSCEELGIGRINIIQSIAEAPDGCILAGTDFGLFIFNPEYETFRRFSLTAADGTGITSPVYDICTGTDGGKDVIWVATYGQGIFCIDAGCLADGSDSETGDITRYSTEDILPTDCVRNIYIDSKGRVWVLTFSDRFGYLSPSRDSLISFSHYGDHASDRYDVILEDGNDIFWLGNYTHGLSRFNLRTGEFTDFLTPGSEGYANHIRCMCKYSSDILLIASDSGLTYFNTRTYGYRTQKSDRNVYYNLNDDYVHSLFIDKEKGLWVGTYFGGVNYSPFSAGNFILVSPHSPEWYIEGKIVSVVETDGDDNLWLGTDDAGVIFYDRQTGHRRQWLPDGSDNSISYHNIHAICCDGDKVWIGTYSAGLDVLDRGTGKFRHYRADGNPGSLIHSSVYALYRSSDNTMWVGTPAGCCIYDDATDSFIPVQETLGADISCITEDAGGYVLISSYNQGLFRFDKYSKKWQHFTSSEGGIPSDIVTTVSCGPDGRVWIGTDGGGIACYNPETMKFDRYDAPVLSDTPVHRIIEYGGSIWASTNKGLVRLYRTTADWKLYDVSDGLQSIQFCPNSGAVTRDGVLLFGGINGLNAFRPEELIENTVVPSVYITDISLFNSPLHPGDGKGILDRAPGYTDEITLRHDESVLGIDFVSLSFTNPDKNMYRYRLEGLEDEWVSSSRRKSVTYTNLSPGTYTFRVMASNNDMLWNESGASLRIRVLPAPWFSVWAIIAYALIFTAGAFMAVRISVRRIREAHASSLMKLRVAKEKELYESKMAFFTDMIHEIRTPLTLIVGPLANIMKSCRNFSKENREDLQMIGRNSERLLSLVNQLLDYRKAEAGTMRFKLSAMDLNLCVSQIVAPFTASAHQRGIEMDVSLPEEHIFGEFDQDAMTRILSNLLSNALKFTSDKVILAIAAEDMDDGRRRLLVRCDDNGGGIPEEEREKIFDTFYQIRSNQPKDFVGSGLGLSLVKSIVNYLGGEVSVGTAAIGGASFLVTFPFRPSAPSGQMALTGEERMTDEDGELLPDRQETSGDILQDIASVMVVDDNPDMLAFLSGRLSEHYDVLPFSNADDALKSMAGRMPDLIVSDVMMQGMDGFTFCRNIKNTLGTCHISVILLTAKADLPSKIEGLDCGADIYVEKPFSMDFLEAQIHSLLLNRKKIQESFARRPQSDASSLASTKEDAVFLRKVNEYIDENLRETSFTAGDIAVHVGMSRSAFFTKLRAVTGQTPSDYVRIIRLKKAARYFNEGETRINEVCYMTGFNSPSYFSKCFYRQFGEVPTAYVRKINGEKKDS